MAGEGGRIKLSWGGEVMSREPACVECGVSWMDGICSIEKVVPYAICCGWSGIAEVRQRWSAVYRTMYSLHMRYLCVHRLSFQRECENVGR
jgi:hypothetical protein